MLQIRQIAYQSLISTNRRRHWWILALGQVAGFFSIGQLSRPSWQSFPWMIGAVILVVPITVWLWLDIAAVNLNANKELGWKIFLTKCLTVFAILFCALAIIILARAVYLNWIFLSLFSSLILATASLAMLYVVLCGQVFVAAWSLALDTWHKKISLALLAALILVAGHGISFAFVHAVWSPDLVSGEFSALSHSATIWISLAAFALIIAYLGAVSNCFLVFFFLEVIRRQKYPEMPEQTVTKFTELQVDS